MYVLYRSLAAAGLTLPNVYSTMSWVRLWSVASVAQKLLSNLFHPPKLRHLPVTRSFTAFFRLMFPVVVARRPSFPQSMILCRWRFAECPERFRSPSSRTWLARCRSHCCWIFEWSRSETRAIRFSMWLVRSCRSSTALNARMCCLPPEDDSTTVVALQHAFLPPTDAEIHRFLVAVSANSRTR